MKNPDPRPWILQMQWKSEEEFHKRSWNSGNRVFDSGWKKWVRKFTDLDHAKEQLEIDLHDPTYDFFAGKNWRLFNKTTQETVSVVIEAKTIILI